LKFSDYQLVSIKSTLLFSRSTYLEMSLPTFLGNNSGRDGGERPDHSTYLFLQGSNNFGRDGGERARPLYIYFFEVVMVVRGRDHSHLFLGVTNWQAAAECE
jgi:hypothetical protein